MSIPPPVQPPSLRKPDGLLPLDELVALLQSGSGVGLSPVLKDAHRAGKEISRKYCQIQEAYADMKKDLQNFDQDKAYDGAELAHRRLGNFLNEKVPAYRKGLLRSEELEKLELLYRAEKALSAKKELFFSYLENIAHLERTREYIEMDENIPAYGLLREEKQTVYFRKFAVEGWDDPLRQALVILKQEGMYLPEAKLVAQLNIAPQMERGSIRRLLLHQRREKIKYSQVAEENFLLEEDSSNYFLTGTYCTFRKKIAFKNYLRRDPNSLSTIINTAHAPKAYLENEIERDIPLIGKIPYLLPGTEAPAVYKTLIGREIDKFYHLEYHLQQGIVVMRSRDMGKKMWFEVKTQNPKQVEARFFYGATTDKEKVVAYMLEGSEEIDKECGIDFA